MQVHVPEGADPRDITDKIRAKLGPSLKVFGGIPRSPLLRTLHLDEITGSLGASPVTGGREVLGLDVDVSKVLLRARH